MRIALSIALTASLLWSSAARAESYQCISDMATGFRYDTARKEWREASFRARQRYLLTRPSEAEVALMKPHPVAWILKAAHNNSVEGTCSKDFGTFEFVMCSGISEFRFSRVTGRFLRAVLSGYYLDDPNSRWPEGGLTPHVEIGRCSLIP